MADNTVRQRRPYKGSCHCGATQYVAYFTFPHQQRNLEEKVEQQRFYRCNCTVCHKSGQFHARLNSSPDDFLLLSPTDPFQALGDYQCDNKMLHFFFCNMCGMRCFIFMGEGETIEVDLADIGLGEGKTKAWRPKKEGWTEGKLSHGCYLSVNAFTLEPGQEGLDLREWHENKWMEYLDVLRLGEPDAGKPTYERPHPGGSY